MTEEKRNPIGRFIEEKLVPISTGFAQNRYVRCIGTGSQSLMAIIMIGAVFNLLNSIQIAPYQSFIQATGIPDCPLPELYPGDRDCGLPECGQQRLHELHGRVHGVQRRLCGRQDLRPRRACF